MTSYDDPRPVFPGPPPPVPRDEAWRRLDARMLLVHPVNELVRFLPVLIGIFFLGRTYDAETMQRMGAVNLVAPHAELESTALEVAAEINGKSPTAQRMLKYSFNLIDDGLVGQQLFAGETTRLAYMTDEAQEGRDQFLEKREPDWSPYPWYY